MEATEQQTHEADVEEASERWDEFEDGLEELDSDQPQDEFLSADIPVKSASVNLKDLHPELYARLRRAFQDPRISRTARVSSGVRTYDQQVYLYKKYGRGRAANPDYVRRDGRRGSAHMVQPEAFRYAKGLERGSFGYAVDVGFWGKQEWKLLRAVMAENGLRLTVFRPFEPWHFELDPAGPSAEVGFGFDIRGSGVADVQRLLGRFHASLPNTIPNPGPADGALGAKTEAAIIAWQILVGVDADGAWGPNTEKVTALWLARRKSVLREGSSGDDVVAAKEIVRAAQSLPESFVSPSFDAAMTAATRAWQTTLNLTSDGVWGPMTWAASDAFLDAKNA